ncbi:SH3 domain-containing protein [Streptomyces coeruleorubidus]|uniref:SH3 domain-containing protein n=1 Tax=Streptomyces coeruleorubidus TaxID=116188 RepID=UPI003664B31E
MKRRLAAVVPALAAVAMAVPLALSTPASAAASCGRTASDMDSSSWDRTANGANQRSGSSTGCAILGIAYNTHNLDYHCYTRIGNTSETWTYLRNDTTGTTGWVRDDLLNDGGSLHYCGF